MSDLRYFWYLIQLISFNFRNRRMASSRSMTEPSIKRAFLQTPALSGLHLFVFPSRPILMDTHSFSFRKNSEQDGG
jgi:hypothetical protein